MVESVYKVIELVGTSTQLLGKGRESCSGSSRKISAGSPRRGSGFAGHGDHRWKGGSLPRQSESFIQVRGYQLTTSRKKLTALSKLNASLAVGTSCRAEYSGQPES